MGNVINFMRDGLANILTGRGTSVDRSTQNVWIRRFTTPHQIEQAYLGSWMHRKIVDVPAKDMTRAGRDWDATDEEIEKIEAEEKRLGVWPKLREGLRLGRLGGGAILIGLGDDPSQPLPKNIQPGQIKYLMVLSRWQLSLGERDYDPTSDNFNRPRNFSLSGLARSVTIHPTRLICFHGLPIPTIQVSTEEDRFWGMSWVEACDEPVQQATTAATGFASLIDEAKIDVFKFGGLVDQLSQPDGEAKVTQRVELTTTGKSIHRAVILDKDDDWDQRQLTLTGVRDVIITYDARVAGAADIPATRLFGKAPDGQNATGDSDDENYFQMIGSQQEDDLRPQLTQLDAVLLPSAGVKATLTWTFSALKVLPEKDQAEVENKEADTVSKYANSGLVPESALAKSVQNRLIESQRWPGLKEAIEEAEAAGEGLPEDPEDLGIVPVGNDNPDTPEAAIPMRRAANDVRFMADGTRKTLYVQRKVVNADEIVRWAKSQGLTTTLPAEDMHVTIAFSRAAVDWFDVGTDWGGDEDGRLRVKPGGPRAIERFGDDRSAIVLLFQNDDLQWRHRRIREAGASWDWDDYRPHITLSWNAAGVHVDSIEPYTGPIVLGPELFAEVVEGWKEKVSES